MADGVVAGWFEGLTTEQLTAAASARLAAGGGFALHWWGVSHLSSRDHRSIRAIELGDRVLTDAERENAADLRDRRDWVVSKAVGADPGASDLLTLGPAGG